MKKGIGKQIPEYGDDMDMRLFVAPRLTEKWALRNFILENATVKIINKAISTMYFTETIFTEMHSKMIEAFPVYNTEKLKVKLRYDYNDDMSEYKINWDLMQETNREIDRCKKMLKVYPKTKHHIPAANIVFTKIYNTLAILNNELNEPIQRFINDYKSVQKEKGKRLRVVSRHSI